MEPHWNQIEVNMIKILLIVFSLLFSGGSLAASNLICGIDQNNNGYLGDEGETATCIGNDPGLCPIGKIACNAVNNEQTSDPIYSCPVGTTLKNNVCIGDNEPHWEEYHALDYLMCTSCAGKTLYDEIYINWAPDYKYLGWDKPPYYYYGPRYYTGKYEAGALNTGMEFYIYKTNSDNGTIDYNDKIKIRIGNYRERSSKDCIGINCQGTWTIFVKIGDATATSPSITCVDTYTWNTVENKCKKVIVNQVCPINGGGACMADGSGYSCSPNKCVNTNINIPVDEGDINGGMLVNDGKKTEDGICLDQLYIFSGRGQRCLPSGMSTGYKNCCANKGSALQDNAGSLASMASSVSTISKVYDVAEKGYQAYNAAITAGKTISQASTLAGSAMQGQMLIAFDPTSLAISVAIHFAMKYFMQACDQESMETAMFASSGYCHYVGEYCKKKVPLLGCVQKANAYCCFNSKLARIIHEQGRPQLSTIGDFGTAKAPQCRGFTPDEFQSVDFSKIDLSEYIEDMTKNTTEQIKGQVSDTIKDFYEKTN
ncbi:conjugal transfer protein TraN [Xenorhabdus bovienii]|uniref:conjugal transfer protein TraN n=1 Tax=Xenorhabdus bovienii TaxID=40576 RepID=UPI0023B33DD7|nr:conjugal transfer protein TraN [Xenorhabdus bovienii]MDE9429885.1 conjugal transfer protein TraN [Xenorhabdus bovienii]